MSQHVIFVLGMHRSGTSALTGMLAKLGVVMPETLMAAGVDNPKGFFESHAIMTLNDDILSAHGSSWDDWRAFSIAAAAGTEAVDIEARIGDAIAAEFKGAGLIAIKDPRICRLLPLWAGAVARTGGRSSFLLPYRHPFEVAQSLHGRNGMSIAAALLLWLRHNLDSEVYTRGLKRQFIDMSHLLNDWKGCALSIARHLDITWPNHNPASEEDIENFLDKDLRHFEVDDGLFEAEPLLRGWVHEAHLAFSGLIGGKNRKHNETILDGLRAKLDESATLFWPALQALQAQLKDQKGLTDEVGALTIQVQGQDGRLQHLSELENELDTARKALLGEQALMNAHLHNYHVAMNEIRESHDRERVAWAEHFKTLQQALVEDQNRAGAEAERGHADTQALIAAHNHALEAVAAAHADNVKTLKDAHEMEQAALLAQIDATTKAHAGIVTDLKDAQIAGIQAAAAAHDRALEALTIAHVNGVKTLETTHEAERTSLLARIGEAAAASCEQIVVRDGLLAQIKASADRLEQAQSEHNGIVASLNTSLEAAQHEQAKTMEVLQKYRDAPPTAFIRWAAFKQERL